MNEWRDEPPDAAGWWLWRDLAGDAAVGFALVGVQLMHYLPNLDGRLIDYDGDEIPPGGQWLKVPE